MGTGSFIVALDRATGKEVWKVTRENRRSWATPILVKAGDRTELVASGAEAVVAYDPATGKELWRPTARAAIRFRASCRAMARVRHRGQFGQGRAGHQAWPRG